jgi:hypothetical protein
VYSSVAVPATAKRELYITSAGSTKSIKNFVKQENLDLQILRGIFDKGIWR